MEITEEFIKKCRNNTAILFCRERMWECSSSEGKMTDVENLHTLINSYAEKGLMLPRSRL